MKHIFLFLAAIFVATSAFAINPPTSVKQTEELEYDVYYHWGIIWKKAGNGHLNLFDETADDGTHRLHGKLTGRTLSFIEYFMAVRDTLECWYSPDFVPIEFVKKTNEGSYKAIERNFYSHKLRSGSELKKDRVESTTVDLRRWRNKKGNDQKSFTVDGVGYDMLSAFYMVRSLDFEKMKPGERIEFPVFAGIKMQRMSVKFVKKETTKLRDGSKFDAYRVEMAIKTKDEDGAPLHVWLSTDKSHRPLNVIIQLRRIGAIQCELVQK